MKLDMGRTPNRYDTTGFAGCGLGRGEDGLGGKVLPKALLDGREPPHMLNPEVAKTAIEALHR